METSFWNRNDAGKLVRAFSRSEVVHSKCLIHMVTI